MRTLSKIALGIIVALGASSCANPEDPALVWLLGAANGNTVDQGTISGDYDVSVSDVSGSPAFIFDSTQTISLHVTVLDPVAPVTGSLVQFRELSGDRTGRVLFQAVTGQAGNVSGNFTINTTTQFVRLTVSYNDQHYTFDINIVGLLQIDRTLFLSTQVTAIQIVDTDGDGVPDSEDAYPNDPTRSVSVRFPSEGHYTIAFEDLFPNQGDADFNDYVIQAVHEEDLDSSGQITRVRASYTHVAKGAGYNHTLHMNLADTGGSVTIRRFSPDNIEISNVTKAVTQLRAIDLLPASNTTIAQSNTSPGQTFQAGDRFEIEIVPDQPISRLAVGAAPYDLYLYVINTKKEIHFAGKYFNADGSDRFLDPTGFPWALKVPGNFSWMFERGNIHQAYDFFEPWYRSAGLEHRNWYDFPTAGKVVSY